MKRIAQIVLPVVIVAAVMTAVRATVPSDNNRIAGPYACDGADKTFTWTFGLDDDDDLKVILHNTVTDSNSTLTKTTHYTMATANANDSLDYSSGGTVTTVSAYSSSFTIELRGDTERTQLANFDDEEVEEAFDKLTFIVQELYDLVSRVSTVLANMPTQYSITVYDPENYSAITFTPWWPNLTDYTFVIEGVGGESDVDNFTFTLKERDANGANVTTIEAVTLATDGTAMYYGSVTGSSLDHTEIESTHRVGVDWSADDAGYVMIWFYGHYEEE